MLQGMIKLIIEGLKNFKSQVLQRKSEIFDKDEKKKKKKKKKVTLRGYASQPKKTADLFHG